MALICAEQFHDIVLELGFVGVGYGAIEEGLIAAGGQSCDGVGYRAMWRPRGGAGRSGSRFLPRGGGRQTGVRSCGRIVPTGVEAALQRPLFSACGPAALPARWSLEWE